MGYAELVSQFHQLRAKQNKTQLGRPRGMVKVLASSRAPKLSGPKTKHSNNVLSMKQWAEKLINQRS